MFFWAFSGFQPSEFASPTITMSPEATAAPITSSMP